MSTGPSGQLLSEQLPLPLEPQHPAFPSRSSTLQAQCLELLLRGVRLTHPEFQAKTGSWRLSAVIHELAELGWAIKRTNRPHHARPQRKVLIRVYWLESGVMGPLTSAA